MALKFVAGRAFSTFQNGTHSIMGKGFLKPHFTLQHDLQKSIAVVDFDIFCLVNTTFHKAVFKLNGKMCEFNDTIPQLDFVAAAKAFYGPSFPDVSDCSTLGGVQRIGSIIGFKVTSMVDADKVKTRVLSDVISAQKERILLKDCPTFGHDDSGSYHHPDARFVIGGKVVSQLELNQPLEGEVPRGCYIPSTTGWINKPLIIDILHSQL